ncbi:hypothetical protein BDZ91DRAFT_766341 [Kalaharituber pfeilii]|nr:hypothetical protein BDZ91DRAFT_766341 [Kalaharituber pfeilii]
MRPDACQRGFGPVEYVPCTFRAHFIKTQRDPTTSEEDNCRKEPYPLGNMSGHVPDRRVSPLVRRLVNSKKTLNLTVSVLAAGGALRSFIIDREHLPAWSALGAMVILPNTFGTETGTVLPISRVKVLTSAWTQGMIRLLELASFSSDLTPEVASQSALGAWYETKVATKHPLLHIIHPKYAY